ncbi:glutaminase A [Evansella cellulosilytica]|uniref:glutaminase A n=1 Tax=Evansella cellulosilytica TaxID=1413 RepID=UPI0002DB1487|nr:glutaminase A [Evansella cellulosilytica]
MICDDQAVLDSLIKDAKQLSEKGKVANYIPALEKANPNALSLAIYTGNTTCMTAGNTDETFTLQSISKVIALALALMDRSEEEVFSKVGMEPTGDPYNSMIKLETHSPSKPLNPMINAGALAVTSMIKGKTVADKLDRLLSFIQTITGDGSITYNEEVARSEFNTAYLNRSLCYFMKQHGVIDDSVEQLLELYTKQCAIEVNCSQLAKIGYVIANNGICVDKGEPIIPKNICQILKTFMIESIS